MISAYDGRSMHGLGFFLGLTALNYAEVERESISLSQWSEMLFTMGVQCQFSCACVASLLAVSITYKLNKPLFQSISYVAILLHLCW